MLTHKLIDFNSDYIVKEKITWTELDYALKKGWINYEIVRDYAIKKVEENCYSDKEAYLAGISNENAIDGVLFELANSESFQSKDLIRVKWLYLFVKWIYEKSTTINEMLDKLEFLYDYFDYSDDVGDLINKLNRYNSIDMQSYDVVEEYLINMRMLFDRIYC